MRSIACLGAIAVLSTGALAGVSTRIDLFVFENADGVPTGNLDI